MLQYILSFITLFIILVSNASMDNFQSAFEMMLLIYDVDVLHNETYLDHIETYDKSDDYLLDGSDNFTELYNRYLRYIQSDDLIMELNTNYGQTVTIYKTDANGNATNEVESTYIYEPYAHTHFSDVLDEDRLLLFMDEEFGGSRRRLQTISDCVCVNTLPTDYPSEQDLSDTYCEGVQNQGQYGTCWAFAATAEAECNYNLQNSLTGGDRVKFSECWTTKCSGGGTTSGGYEPTAEKDFVNQGICERADYPSNHYPSCVASGSTCQACSASLKPASDCIQFNLPDSDVSAAANNFLAANRQLATLKHAMTFAMNVGSTNSPLFHLKGDVPVDNICDTGPGWHAMTIQGTTVEWDKSFGSLKVKNSWGTNWGDNGYFWMSVKAFENCKGSRINWNVFNDEVPYPGLTRCDGSAGPAGSENEDGTAKQKMHYITLFVMVFVSLYFV